MKIFIKFNYKKNYINFIITGNVYKKKNVLTLTQVKKIQKK